MISIRELSFTYPGAEAAALDAIDLEVADGDLLLVCGPSGSGKSTLLRVANGLVPHHSGGTLAGRVALDGEDVTGRRPHELAGRVGFVPQDPEAHATADRVTAELTFSMEELGVAPVLMRKRLEEVLDQLGIAHLRDRRLDTLSGGERQRVAIAAVLASQPRVLVCDEPTSSLDPGSAEDVLAVLARLRDELGLTVLCSEHRLERVAPAADKVAALDAGRLVAGDPREVLAERPAPPVTELGRRLGWVPLPLTVREGRRHAEGLALEPPVIDGLAAGETVAACRGLGVRLGGRDVLRGLDLELRRGEVTAIVGRNGSGKTTLMRTLAGLVEPSAGEIRWATPLDALGPRGRAARVAYVPQRAEVLLFRDTVRDELRAAGPDGEAWLDDLALRGVADRHPWALSAGQRLWCALGTALARRPDVHLWDEPTRGLDPEAKDRLGMLMRAEATRGAAVVLVTHDVELVASVADRVAMLAEGEIVADGPTPEVLGESLLFSSQTQKVFGDPRFLTPADVRVRT